MARKVKFNFKRLLEDDKDIKQKKNYRPAKKLIRLKYNREKERLVDTNKTIKD